MAVAKLKKIVLMVNCYGLLPEPEETAAYQGQYIFTSASRSFCQEVKPPLYHLR
jgi:hypothetical protein